MLQVWIFRGWRFGDLGAGDLEAYGLEVWRFRGCRFGDLGAGDLEI